MTDNRYPYEIFPDWIVIKLFRKDVPIPPMDDYPFDFVLVPTSEDYDLLCELSPQCKQMVYLGDLW